MNTFAGFDATDSLLGKGKDIKAAGYSWVIKYALPSAEYPNKAWAKAELAEMRIFGIKAGVVFETANTIDHFTAANGAADATRIVATMKLLKAPTGKTGAFFAVDFDATHDQITGPITEYAAAFRMTVKGAGYLPGAYGSGLLLRLLGRNLGGSGLIHWHWLAQSEGWGEYAECIKAGNWDIKQGIGSVLNLNSDPDEAATLAWAF